MVLMGQKFYILFLCVYLLWVFILDEFLSLLFWCSTKMSTLIEIYKKFGLREKQYGCNTSDSSWDVPSSIIPSLRWWWVLVMITLAVVSILDKYFTLLRWCSTKGSILIWFHTKSILITEINHLQAPYSWRYMDI